MHTHMLQKSTRDIIADASNAPLWQIILGIVLVSVYGFIAFINVRDPVHSHTGLALVVRFETLPFLLLKSNDLRVEQVYQIVLNLLKSTSAND